MLAVFEVTGGYLQFFDFFKNFHPLVHSPSACNGWGCLMAGDRNSLCVSHTVAVAGRLTGRKLDRSTDILTYGGSVSIGGLPHCTAMPDPCLRASGARRAVLAATTAHNLHLLTTAEALAESEEQ